MPCAECGGSGYIVVQEHASDCVMNWGGPCDCDCPVPVQARCPSCATVLMAAPSEDLVERLTKAALEAKEVIREAHGIQRDLERAIREAKAEIRDLASERLDRYVAEQLDRVLKESRVSEWGEALKRSHRQWSDMLKEATTVMQELAAVKTRADESADMLEQAVERADSLFPRPSL